MDVTVQDNRRIFLSVNDFFGKQKEEVYINRKPAWPIILDTFPFFTVIARLYGLVQVEAFLHYSFYDGQILWTFKEKEEVFSN